MKNRKYYITGLGKEKSNLFYNFFEALPRGLNVYLDNFGCSCASFVSLGQIISEFLVRCFRQSLLLPQVGCQICISFGNCSISSFSKVAKGASRSPGWSIAVLDTSHLKKLLGNRGRYDAGTSGRRYQTYLHRTALTGHLTWHRVRLANFVTPVTASNRYDRELSQNNSTTNCSGYLLGAFHSQSNMSIAVSDSNKSL